MAKEIKKSEILSMLQEGKTRIEIAKYFGTSPTNLAKGMKQLGIDDVRAKRVTFVDDTIEQQTVQAEDLNANTSIAEELKDDYNLEEELEKITSNSNDGVLAVAIDPNPEVNN